VPRFLGCESKLGRSVPFCYDACMTATTRRQDVQQAFEDLLTALGASPRGALAGSPKRAAALWAEHLLAGEHEDLGRIIGKGMKTKHRTPVAVTGVGMHLVCPHHLTVAFGAAHVAYAPAGKLVGLGTLTRLVRACTARFVLQEEAGQLVADALVEHLGAEAAAVLIVAEHPCHNITEPRAHRAKAATWAQAGRARAVGELKSLILCSLPQYSGT
jgi:GTP cyclohydrolase I